MKMIRIDLVRTKRNDMSQWLLHELIVDFYVHIDVTINMNIKITLINLTF